MTGPAGWRLGLDIGGTKTLGVAVDPLGRIRARRRVRTEPGVDGVRRGAERVVRALADDIGGLPPGPVGVGVPGLVDVDHGTVRHAVNLGLDGTPVPLAARLSETFQRPVVLDNDVNAAALGVMCLTGERDLAYLSVGTGLGAGLVLDGRLRCGARGLAGEVGHVQVDPAGRRCPCGRRGCLETLGSGTALRGGVPPARATAAVASAVVLIALSVDVQTVVLGGGVADQGEVFLTAVRAALTTLALESALLGSMDLPARVLLAPPGRPVAAVGAALLGTLVPAAKPA